MEPCIGSGHGHGGPRIGDVAIINSYHKEAIEYMVCAHVAGDAWLCCSKQAWAVSADAEKIIQL